MKEISLTKGKVTLVDDDLYEYLSQWKWQFAKGYATRASYDAKSGKKIRISMHRLISQAPDNMVVDHRDGNGLHNYRTNLRVCTTSQNIANSRIRSNNTSGYKGVYFNAKRGFYTASIKVLSRTIHLGCFDTAIEAGIAYNHAALKFFGEFSLLNPIPNWEMQTPIPHAQYENLLNSNSSGYRGVSFHGRTNKWVAYIYVQRQQIHIGYFDTAEGAARAYDTKARKLFGASARTNFG